MPRSGTPFEGAHVTQDDNLQEISAEIPEAAQRALIPEAAQRALAEAAERRALRDEQAQSLPREVGGTSGPDPARYGDWEKDGIVSDF